MRILRPILALSTVLQLSVQAAVVNIERPPGVLMGAPLGVDFNNDNSDDVVVRFYDLICVSGGSATSCTNGVTITFGSNVALFGSIEDGQLTPRFLPEGTLLGPTTPDAAWTSTGGLYLDLIYRFGSPSLPNEGYPAYAQALERMYIGFRVAEGSEFRYGWMDVQLKDPPVLPDRLQMDFPEFNGVYICDLPQQGIVVFPIPEPSTVLFLCGGAMLMITLRSRNPRGEQGVPPNGLSAIHSHSILHPITPVGEL